MDWIDINEEKPIVGSIIWAKDPNGNTLIGECVKSDNGIYVLLIKNYYFELTKWATYDVIY